VYGQQQGQHSRCLWHETGHDPAREEGGADAHLHHLPLLPLQAAQRVSQVPAAVIKAAAQVAVVVVRPAACYEAGKQT
jgi:hypothetical protein